MNMRAFNIANLRSSGPKIITSESLADGDRKVPAALVLPEGKFFFGFKYTPFDPAKVPKKQEAVEDKPAAPFGGEGNSLKRRRGDNASVKPSTTSANVISPVKEEKEDPWAKLGSGNALAPKKIAPIATPAAPPSRQDVIDATMMDEDDFDVQWDEGDNDDIVEIDSD